MDRLVAQARSGRLAVFAGAGLSVPPPTCLPTWWALQSAVLEGLCSELGGLVGHARAHELGELLLARQREERLPPEYQAQILADRLGRRYFEVLRLLDGDVPNAAHVALAAMAKAGMLGAILTTNFDRLVEVAFDRLHVPLQVVAGNDAFEQLERELEQTGPCRLLKLHGSVEDPDSLIDTLAQRKKGLTVATARCVRHHLQHFHWLFIGWSGLDLAANSNYLWLRGDADRAKGFSWLVRSGTEPRPEVKALVDLYGGDRADVISGTLPEWIEDLARRVGVEPPATRVETPEAVERRRDRVARSVADSVRQWARNSETRSCALSAADLLRAAAEPEAAIGLTEALVASTPADRRTGESFALVLAALGVLRREREDLDEAQRLFNEALALLERAGSERQRLTTLANMALIDQTRGRDREAAQAFLQLADANTRLGDDRSKAANLHNAALSLFNLGRFGEAMLLYHQEIALVERCGDEVGRAGALQSLAEALIATNRLDEAEPMLMNVLTIQSRLGDDRSRAQAVATLGDVVLRRGEWQRAEAYLYDALTIFERLGARSDRATVLSSLGRIALERGDCRNAARLFSDELALRESIGGEYGPAIACTNLGAVHIVGGELSTARRLLERAGDSFERLGNMTRLVTVWRNLATIARREGRRLDEAQFLRRSVDALRGLGDSETCLTVLYDLARVLWDMNEPRELEMAYLATLEIESARNNHPGRAQSLVGLGSVRVLLGNVPGAEAALREALAIHEALGDVAGTKDVTARLAMIIDI